MEANSILSSSERLEITAGDLPRRVLVWGPGDPQGSMSTRPNSDFPRLTGGAGVGLEGKTGQDKTLASSVPLKKQM